MLVVLYIISAVSGVFSSICIEKEKFKHWFIATLIAVLTGIAFCWAMIDKIINNMADLNFWSVFSVLSLIAWQAAFIFDNYENLFDYEFSFVLFACTICLLHATIFEPYTREVCTTTHITQEVIFLVTTLDASETGESVYGNGFIVSKVSGHLSSSKNSSYLYYYRLEDGTLVNGNIPEHSTTIEYIGTDESPYLEVTIIRDCLGYYPKTETHSLSFAEKTYRLYIPENSILNVLKID